MKRTHKSLFISLLSLFALVSVASKSSAQSLWLPRGQDHGVLIEVFKPDFDEIDEDFVSFATFIGARFPASTTFTHVLEFSFARFGGVFPGINGPTTLRSFTLGDAYIGIELGERSAPLFGELGVRLPTAGQDEAAAAGRASDLTRSHAFFSNVVSVQTALNVRRVTPGGVSYRLRLSPVFMISTDRAVTGSEVFAFYSGQLGYERQAFRLGMALSARTSVTENKTDTQAEFHADLGSGRARPGLELKFPLGDLGDAVPIVVGVSLGVSY